MCISIAFPLHRFGPPVWKGARSCTYRWGAWAESSRRPIPPRARTALRRPCEDTVGRLRTLLGMADPVQLIADSVRDRARHGELGVGAEAAVREELRRYSEKALGSDAPLIGDERRAERQIVADLTGFGPLQPLLDDPSVEESWINGPTRDVEARRVRREPHEVGVPVGERGA